MNSKSSFMTQPEEKEFDGSEYYAAIEGLRAFSCIGIILMHVLANGNFVLSGFVFEKLIPSFNNLVFLFMIISGFVMCCGYYDQLIENKITLGKFYSKRYERIWPFFAILCAFDLVISPSINSLYEAFANLTLCFGLIPNSNISVIGVGWFLGVVFVFYLMFPFVCYLLADKRRAWGSFIVAVVFTILCSDYFKLQRTDFIYCAMFFIAGGLIFLYRKKLQALVTMYRPMFMIICIVITPIQYILGYSDVLIVMIFSLYVIYALSVSKKGMLNNNFTKFLSKISMEMYLCHMAVYRVIEKTGNIHMFDNELLSYVLCCIITVVGTILTSHVISAGIEKIKFLKVSI